MMKYKFLLLFSLTILFSCGKDQMVEDEEIITQYLTDNGLNGQMVENGLYVVIDNEGSTEKPEITSTVTVDYEGFYVDGEKFDSSYDRGEPIEAELFNFIQGWQIGLQEFGRGGSGAILIPSHLGYGSNPPTGIRKDAVLIFNIEMIDFN